MKGPSGVIRRLQLWTPHSTITAANVDIDLDVPLPHQRIYDYQKCDIWNAADVPFAHLGPDDDEFSILHNVYAVGDHFVSNHQARDFFVFTQYHPTLRAPVAKPKGEAKQKLRAAVKEQLLLEFPWLPKTIIDPHERKKFDHPYSFATKDVTDDIDGDGSSAGDSDGEDDIDLDPEAVEREMELLRIEFRVGQNPNHAFYVRPLMGRWTARHHGATCNAVGGFARRGEPCNWADLFFWPRQAAF
jgi:hypothetical protein